MAEWQGGLWLKDETVTRLAPALRRVRIRIMCFSTSAVRHTRIAEVWIVRATEPGDRGVGGRARSQWSRCSTTTLTVLPHGLPATCSQIWGARQYGTEGGIPSTPPLSPTQRPGRHLRSRVHRPIPARVHDGIPDLSVMLAADTPKLVCDQFSAEPLAKHHVAGSDDFWFESTPKDVALLIYTGGTTGPSKGCVITNGYVFNLRFASLPDRTHIRGAELEPAPCITSTS